MDSNQRRPKSGDLQSPVIAARQLGEITNGREDGIRTHGTLLKYDALARRWFKPLTHLSRYFFLNVKEQMAGVLGLEPTLWDLESQVLPVKLHP